MGDDVNYDFLSKDLMRNIKDEFELFVNSYLSNMYYKMNNSSLLTRTTDADLNNIVFQSHKNHIYSFTFLNRICL